MKKSSAIILSLIVFVVAVCQLVRPAFADSPVTVEVYESNTNTYPHVTILEARDGAEFENIILRWYEKADQEGKYFSMAAKDNEILSSAYYALEESGVHCGMVTPLDDAPDADCWCYTSSDMDEFTIRLYID